MALSQEEATARSENLLRDAEDALHTERLHAIWREWGSTIMGMALMLVIGTAGGVMWRNWRETSNEKATTALIDTLSKDGAATQNLDDLDGAHAAIAYLEQAGLRLAAATDGAPATDLAALYKAAADKGDDTSWGWLAHLNALRVQMDDPKTDAKALLKDYEALAKQRKGTALAALAYVDAAIIAGERLNDKAAALSYLSEATPLVSHTNPISQLIIDLKHLYTLP